MARATKFFSQLASLCRLGSYRSPYYSQPNGRGGRIDMKSQDANRSLLALCALPPVGDKRVDWSLLAREATRPDGLQRLYEGRVVEQSPAAADARSILGEALLRIGEATERVEAELSAAVESGARLVTVLDDDYPSNLRFIPNLPPFLFIRGDALRLQDLRSVCVVGTRQPSADGLRLARQMAERLAAEGVTVVSGLARGIDTEAHRATLDGDGRTIAVIGNGATRTYPPENEALADEIACRGAVVSSFWPTAPPTRWSFPARNVVMSGMAQGTVVIEASGKSGAKMQARLALEHDKQVFLVKSLVTDQEWARRYVDERGAVEVDDVEQVFSRLADPQRVLAKAEQRRRLSQMALELV